MPVFTDGNLTVDIESEECILFMIYRSTLIFTMLVDTVHGLCSLGIIIIDGFWIMILFCHNTHLSAMAYVLCIIK